MVLYRAPVLQQFVLSKCKTNHDLLVSNRREALIFSSAGLSLLFAHPPTPGGYTPLSLPYRLVPPKGYGFCWRSNVINDKIISAYAGYEKRVWILEARSENGRGNNFWSEIGSRFGEPGGTPLSRIPGIPPPANIVPIYSFKMLIFVFSVCFFGLSLASDHWEHWATMAVRCFVFVIVLSKTKIFFNSPFTQKFNYKRIRQQVCVVILLFHACKLQSYIVYPINAIAMQM